MPPRMIAVSAHVEHVQGGLYVLDDELTGRINAEGVPERSVYGCGAIQRGPRGAVERREAQGLRLRVCLTGRLGRSTGVDEYERPRQQ